MAKPAPNPPNVVVEIALGDSELTVHEFADGMFELLLNGERLLVSRDTMQVIVGAFMRLGHEKGWT